MSLSRIGEDPHWFGESPGYVYVQGGNTFNHGIHEVDQFCELAMRALEQSGELDDETLQECQNALESRFDYTDMEVHE